MEGNRGPLWLGPVEEEMLGWEEAGQHEGEAGTDFAPR